MNDSSKLALIGTHPRAPARTHTRMYAYGQRQLLIMTVNVLTNWGLYKEMSEYVNECFVYSLDAGKRVTHPTDNGNTGIKTIIWRFVVQHSIRCAVTELLIFQVLFNEIT